MLGENWSTPSGSHADQQAITQQHSLCFKPFSMLIFMSNEGMSGLVEIMTGLGVVLVGCIHATGHVLMNCKKNVVAIFISFKGLDS